MKSPLLIGTNVRQFYSIFFVVYAYLSVIFDRLSQLSAITDDILGILKNREILAINQDPVEGSSISPFRWGINVCFADLYFVIE